MAFSISKRPVAVGVHGADAIKAACFSVSIALGVASNICVDRVQPRNILPASLSAFNSHEARGRAIVVHSLGPAARKTNPRLGARTPTLPSANGTPFNQVALGRPGDNKNIKCVGQPEASHRFGTVSMPC
ncbi:hypothetical protein D9M68_811710 [compost metagenome]